MAAQNNPQNTYPTKSDGYADKNSGETAFLAEIITKSVKMGIMASYNFMVGNYYDAFSGFIKCRYGSEAFRSFGVSSWAMAFG